MTVHHLTRDNFDMAIDEHSMVVVDFWASWCGPCRVFEPIYETLATRYPHIFFGKVNIEEEIELAQDFNVRSIPMIMIFRDNIAVSAEVGALTETEFETVLQNAEKLDLSEIKKKIMMESRSDEQSK